MTDLERAIRYLCLFETNENEVKINRYETIESMVHGNDELIDRYSKKYEKMLDLLS